MVYCTKCGTKNEENVKSCINCNESLMITQTARGNRKRKEDNCFGSQKENDCFGLPHGGAIGGILIGLIIVLWGLSSFLDISFGSYMWPIIIIIFGTLMVIGALYSMNRRR